jgi:hypothetical protein
MGGFTKLFSSIVLSSIWSEDDKTRLVWITLLALSNADGYVSASLPGLASTARVSIPDCECALQKLAAPDPYSRNKDHEGRRIEAVDGGWLILNYRLYRDRVSDNPTAVKTRERVQRCRQRKNEPLAVDSKQHMAFDRFWELYPRKVAKESARKAFSKIPKIAETLPVILAALEWQCQSPQWAKDGGRFIPHPASYLNGRRWLDEPPTGTNKNSGKTKSANLDGIPIHRGDGK